MTRAAWMRRQEAARIYRPKTIRLLLVAESPPDDESRYFYFAGGTTDELFEQVGAVLFESPPQGDKAPRLKELRRRGVFVVELKPDATLGGAGLDAYVAPFLLNLETLAAAHIALIGSDLHAALNAALANAGLPLVDVRIPSPSAEHETEFRRALRQALVRAGLESLIRPLRPARAKAAEAE